MTLADFINPLAEELAAGNGVEQAAFFDAFAHKLYVGCATDHFHTQQQLCAIGDHMGIESKRMFRDMVEMFKKIESGYGG